MALEARPAGRLDLDQSGPATANLLDGSSLDIPPNGVLSRGAARRDVLELADDHPVARRRRACRLAEGRRSALAQTGHAGRAADRGGRRARHRFRRRSGPGHLELRRWPGRRRALAGAGGLQPDRTRPDRPGRRRRRRAAGSSGQDPGAGAVAGGSVRAGRAVKRPSDGPGRGRRRAGRLFRPVRALAPGRRPVAPAADRGGGRRQPRRGGRAAVHPVSLHRRHGPGGHGRGGRKPASVPGAGAAVGPVRRPHPHPARHPGLQRRSADHRPDRQGVRRTGAPHGAGHAHRLPVVGRAGVLFGPVCGPDRRLLRVQPAAAVALPRARGPGPAARLLRPGPGARGLSTAAPPGRRLSRPAGRRGRRSIAGHAAVDPAFARGAGRPGPRHPFQEGRHRLRGPRAGH